MKNILILGSTGSIGVNTLEIIRSFPDQFKVSGLSTNCRIDLIEEQIAEFNPGTVVVGSKSKADELKFRIGNKCEILSGEEGLLEISSRGNYDIFVSALVGFAGLAPTVKAIEQKKRIALANKETLVVAGEIIINLCKEYGVDLLPIDSEHSAIFQCLVGEDKKNISKIILTASGGPFLNKQKSELENVSVSEALNHPNWKMGNKITIDSATMMNKGLEIIEAYWLFNLPKEKIEVVIHPQSIIHSMVEYSDGSIKAQMSSPDMKLPILYALTYPERLIYNGVPTNLKKIRQLTFFEPDFNKFECLKIAYDVIKEGGTAPCILNAANEIAVDKFLNGKIKFTEIPDLIKKALDKIEKHPAQNIETIFECDLLTRKYLSTKFN
jgi:1-deoxy-D-xylulose-5-phosphate reductoisomerase